jgi:hypothetical protein
MWLAVFLWLGVAPVAPSLPVDAKPVAAVTDTRLADWVRTWQKRLRLDDWNIEARFVRVSELKPDTLGNLKWNSVARQASIKILAPQDYDLPAGEIEEDVEYTVVHELVHLQLSALPRDLNRRDTEEQVVNRLADALMQLERGTPFHARSRPVIPYRPSSARQTAPGVAGRQVIRPGPLSYDPKTRRR